MISKIINILIVLLSAALLLLAGLFYWDKKHSFTILLPFGLNQNSSSELPSSSENEIATSSPPFVIQGEISRGNPDKKQIIFTFDCGAGTNSAQKILETAKKHNIKTTFFTTGKFAEQNPELIKQISSEGHEIFNHTYSHPHLTQIIEEQIKEELGKTEQIINDLTGKSTKPYFRPPYGDRNAQILEICEKLGWQSVYWTLDALDWMKGRTEEETKQRIYSKLTNSVIILMHVGDDITGNILDEVFTKIEKDDYKIVSLTEGLK